MDGLVPRQIIKQITVVFDCDLMMLDARNFERVAKLHLKRCDDADAAKKIAEILAELSEAFANKKL